MPLERAMIPNQARNAVVYGILCCEVGVQWDYVHIALHLVSRSYVLASDFRFPLDDASFKTLKSQRRHDVIIQRSHDKQVVPLFVELDGSEVEETDYD